MKHVPQAEHALNVPCTFITVMNTTVLESECHSHMHGDHWQCSIQQEEYKPGRQRHLMVKTIKENYAKPMFLYQSCIDGSVCSALKYCRYKFRLWCLITA